MARGAGGCRPKLQTNLDRTIIRRISEALREGNTIEVSCSYAGISRFSYYNWIRLAEADPDGNTIYNDFRNAAVAARSDAERRNVQVIQRAAMGFETRVIKTKTTTEDVPLYNADGSPMLDDDGAPMTKTVSTTETWTETSQKFDWRAAESWLKRRNRAEWGDAVEFNRLPDDKIVELLEAAARAGGDEAGSGDPGAAEYSAEEPE